MAVRRRLVARRIEAGATLLVPGDELWRGHERQLRLQLGGPVAVGTHRHRESERE